MRGGRGERQRTGDATPNGVNRRCPIPPSPPGGVSSLIVGAVSIFWVPLSLLLHPLLGK